MDIKSVITAPITRTLLLIVAMVFVAPNMGAISEWSMHLIAKGVVNNERFDRVVYCGADKAACDAADIDDSWRAATLDGAGTALTANKYMKLAKDGDGCQLASTATVASSPTAGMTPKGTVVALTGAGDVTGCTWEKASSVFTRGGMNIIITILISVMGLAIPVGGMMALANFGASFVQRIGGGGIGLIITGVMVLIGLLILAVLGSTLIPYVGEALDAIDADRFYILSLNLGLLGPLLGDFWGVILMASVAGVVWQVVTYFRMAGNSGGGGSGIFSPGGRGGMA